MNKIKEMIKMLALAVVGVVGLAAYGGEIIDLTAAVRATQDAEENALAMKIIKHSDFHNMASNRNDPTLWFDGTTPTPYGDNGATTPTNDKNFNKLNANSGVSIEFAFPSQEEFEPDVYVTSCQIEMVSGTSAKNLFLYGRTAEDQAWVLLGKLETTKGWTKTVVYVEGDKMGSYRQFKLAMNGKWSSQYVINEIRLFGVTQEADMPLSSLEIVVEPSELVEANPVTPGVGIYKCRYLADAAQTISMEASGYPLLGETTYNYVGYELKITSADGSTTTRIGTESDLAYVYTPQGIGEMAKITWKYQKGDVAMRDEVYVRSTGGDNKNVGDEENPVSTIDRAIALVKENGTIHLDGVFSQTDQLKLTAEDSNVSFVGVGTDGAVVETASGVSARLFELDGCSNVRFRGITFRNGRPEAGKGGAFLVSGAQNIVFENCRFTDNEIARSSGAAYGGAICAENSTLVTVDCRFERNVVSSSSGNGSVCGAAIAFTDSTADTAKLSCTNTVFLFNRAKSSSAGETRGVVAYFGETVNSEFENCLFAYNESSVGTGIGAGVIGFPADGASGTPPERARLQNCTIAYNLAGAAASGSFGAGLVATNSILWGQNQIGISHNGFKMSLRDCFYDNIHDGYVVDGVSFVNNKRQNPQLQANLMPSGAATGYGYHTTDTVSGKTIRVNPLATGEGAVKSLTAALAAAGTGDTILLEAGVYDESVETFPIRVADKQHLTIRGAGAGQTVFRNGGAAGSGTCLVFTNLYASSVSGFSIDGYTANEEAATPAAILVRTCSYLTIRDIAVENCSRTATQKDLAMSGGIFRALHSNGLALEGCRFRNNTVELTGSGSTLSGGVASFGSVFAVVDRCAFSRNEIFAPTVSGLALYVAGSYNNRDYVTTKYYRDCKIQNSLIADNRLKSDAEASVAVHGDPIALTQETLHLMNCTIVGTANGSIHSASNSEKPNLFAENCLFKGVKGMTYKTDHSCATNLTFLYHCMIVTNDVCTAETFAYNTMSNLVSSSQFQNYNPMKAGLSTDVYYVADAGFKNAARGNYKLMPSSPAADKGKVLYWMDASVTDKFQVDWRGVPENPLDLAGDARIVGDLPDIGCYERPKPTGFSIILR